MSQYKDVRVGDEGTKFLVTLKEDGGAVDISTSTVKTIKFSKPEGSVVTMEATYESNGADGKIYYIAGAGFLDEVGGWKLQGYVELSTGKWSSSVGEFQVEKNL